MRTNVVMPKLGESITEGTIIKWVKQVGDSIKKDETLLEVGTDKVDSDIPSPASGVLVEICVPENETVDVETVIAILETEGSAAATPAASSTASATPSTPAAPTPAAPQTTQAPQPAATPKKPAAKATSNRFYSPLVLKMAQEEGISMEELESVPGTGSNGRVTKKDIQYYVEHRDSTPRTVVAQSARTNASQSTDEAHTVVTPTEGSVVLEADYARMKIAEHMRHSLDTSAHAYLLVEADVSNIMNHIKANKAQFLEEQGFKLTFTPFLLYAVSRALQAHPMMNSSFDADNRRIIQHKAVNLGLATHTEKGLMVPVLKHVDSFNLKGIARAANQQALDTRQGKLNADAFRGATFTLSNVGAFGSIVGLSIINQPNAGIMAVGAVKKRPMVVEYENTDGIAIRSMVYLSLSLDHRLIDGVVGAKFLQTVVQELEGFSGNW